LLGGDEPAGWAGNEENQGITRGATGLPKEIPGRDIIRALPRVMIIERIPTEEK
jgi:hypothetical protein